MFSRFQIILLSRFFLNLQSVVNDREETLDTASDIRFSIDRDFGGSVVFGAQEQNDDELWTEEEDEMARESGALDAEGEIGDLTPT